VNGCEGRNDKGVNIKKRELLAVEETLINVDTKNAKGTIEIPNKKKRKK
jgi:hypothetical protein